MAAIPLIIGVLLVGVAAAVAVSPTRLGAWAIRFTHARCAVLAAALLRVSAGVLLILAAPGTRWPTLIVVFGAVFVAAGVGVLFMGRTRLQAMAQWWLARPPAVLRAWAALAGLLGAMLVLSVVWGG